jgi:PPOX class probable F420-dependent enzyme
MDLPAHLDAIRSLLDAPSPAILTMYRADGTAHVSPVWYRVSDDAFEVVIMTGNSKLVHLARDPRCVLVVFEAVPPFRGVEVRGEATLGTDRVAETRLAIACRYLGADRGRRFAEGRGGHGVVLRLPTQDARVWDLAAILPR